MKEDVLKAAAELMAVWEYEEKSYNLVAPDKEKVLETITEVVDRIGFGKTSNAILINFRHWSSETHQANCVMTFAENRLVSNFRKITIGDRSFNILPKFPDDAIKHYYLSWEFSQYFFKDRGMSKQDLMKPFSTMA
jgi:hypothetical protein